MEAINLMGITITRSAASPSFRPQTNCAYYGTVCHECNCDKCSCGSVLFIDCEGFERARQCDCMIHANTHNNLRKEGLAELVDKCTFDSYNTFEPWQNTIKSKALDYLNEWKHNSFFISGQSGSGKTHICVAIINALSNAGVRISYFKWLENSTELKGVVTDYDRYKEKIKPFIECDLLYIDDFFKQSVTDADIRLAYEIIDARYTAGLPTVISSERSIEYIRSVKDNEGEAIAGRIMEMCDSGKYCIHITGADKNQRLHRKG